MSVPAGITRCAEGCGADTGGETACGWFTVLGLTADDVESQLESATSSIPVAKSRLKDMLRPAV
jgi:hypothetical protein